MQENKHYFCLLKPARAAMHETVTEAELEVFGRHCDYLKRLFAEKKVLQAGTSFEKGEEHFAIVILSAENKEKAVELINGDPAVAEGLLLPRVTEYEIFLDQGR